MNSISVPVPMSDVSGVSPAGWFHLKCIVERSVVFGAISGAMLLSWGWEQILVLFSHPARAAVFMVIALQFALSIAQIVAGNLVEPQPRRRVREPWFFLFLSGAVLLVLSSPFFDGRILFYLPGKDVTRYAGMAMFVAGAVLATWAQRHLGRYFSGELAIQKGHQLVTDGPFTLVRHPRYVGLMLMFVGLPMAFLSQIGLVGGVVCLALFVLRTYREEKLLAGEFGGEWSRYTRSTKRLIPWVY